MFGLLNLKPARRLGALSYDLYLVHGLILATAFAIPEIKAVALSSPAAYWLTLSGIVVVALAAALMLRVLVELPGLAAGRRLRASLTPNSVRQAEDASEYARTT
jgi:peptidoglycan/LPS O-acetylase OafA/YrhL